MACLALLAVQWLWLVHAVTGQVPADNVMTFGTAIKGISLVPGQTTTLFDYNTTATMATLTLMWFTGELMWPTFGSPPLVPIQTIKKKEETGIEKELERNFWKGEKERKQLFHVLSLLFPFPLHAIAFFFFFFFFFFFGSQATQW